MRGKTTAQHLSPSRHIKTATRHYKTKSSQQLKKGTSRHSNKALWDTATEHHTSSWRICTRTMARSHRPCYKNRTSA
eukprot:7126091-Ditylum_brightwellii.AAC.1